MLQTPTTRCHTARGEHSLSAAAYDAALDGSKQGYYWLHEALAVRGRAAAGLAAEGAGAHWSEYTGKLRVAEVAGRMQGDAGVLERALDPAAAAE